MPTDPYLVQRLAADVGGVIGTNALLAAGISQHSIKIAVATGAIIRARQGMFVHPDVPSDVRSAVAHGGALTCISRLRAAGVWLLADDDTAHVALHRSERRFAHPGCRCIPHGSPHATSRLGSVSIARALIDAFRCRGPEEFVVALESAMRKRLVSQKELLRLRGLLPSRARGLVDDARWDADSGLESLLRYRLRPFGIELQSQVEVPGVGRVDFVLGDRLILEVDGKPGHVGAAERHKDLVRDAVAAAHGFDTLRFDYALIVHDWALVESAILTKLRLGLHLTHRPNVGRFG